jgi:hypothetical protein
VTDGEFRQITDWFKACASAQPTASLALLLYVRENEDGEMQVYLGLGGIALEMKDFPLDDLPAAKQLVCAALEKALVERPGEKLIEG